MGTWSSPGTEAKAKKLAALMEKPLTKKDADKLLYDLMGDDELFDRIAEADDHEDVRLLVLSALEEMLAGLDRFFVPWDSEAIRICQQLVDNA